jgi:hypothetical protein
VIVSLPSSWKQPTPPRSDGIALSRKTCAVPFDFFHTKIADSRNTPDCTGLHAQKPLGAVDAVFEKRFYCSITEPIGFKRHVRLIIVRHSLRFRGLFS